jgi:hypothetical protein
VGKKPKLLGAEPLRGGAGSDWTVSSADGLAYACVSQMSATMPFQSEWILCKIVGDTRNDVVAHTVLRMAALASENELKSHSSDLPSRRSSDL